MPDRVLGRHPRFSAYLILTCALVILALSIWVYLLSGRVSDAEAIRKAQAESECRLRIVGTRTTNNLLLAIKDLAKIPQMNLRAYLADPLPPAQRANYEDALRRYVEAEAKFVPFPIPSCVRTDS